MEKILYTKDMDIINKLKQFEDKKYKEFEVKLTPGIDINNVIGVRVPDVRSIAKELYKSNDYKDFLDTLPHLYFDEYMLHGLIISLINDYDTCVKELDRFLPYVDNWAVCDITSPKIFKKHHDKLIKDIKRWVKSNHLYTKRFGVGMLMGHYLDEDFKEEYLKIPASIKSSEYYMNMMIAWFYATALAKKWDETIKYLKENKLSVWVHNKTIQKAIESFRISPEQKEYLKTLKR